MVDMANRKDGSSNLESILERLAPIADQSLAQLFHHGVLERDFSGDTLSSVCCSLASKRSICRFACIADEREYSEPALTPTARIACALLQHRPIESWSLVNSLFESVQILRGMFSDSTHMKLAGAAEEKNRIA